MEIELTRTSQSLHEESVGGNKEPIQTQTKAVEEMHRKGIIHVDLKECNTLFDPVSGKVVILDFGSCMMRGLINKNIRTTKGYSAPELSHRSVRTCAIDLWSVGAIFVYQVSHS